jgi:predicted transcriptional regulator
MTKDWDVESYRVCTAKLPADLAAKLDEHAERLDRSKSWIIHQAVADWVAEEELRYQMTLEALADVDAGRMFTAEQVEEHFAQRRAERAKRA